MPHVWMSLSFYALGGYCSTGLRNSVFFESSFLIFPHTNLSTSLIPFLLPKHPIVLSVLSFKFIAYSSLIVIACINLSVYTHIFLNVTFSVDMLLICVFSGLNTCNWTTNMGKTPFPSPSFPQLPIVSCVGSRPQGLFPIHFGTCIGVIFVQVTIVLLYW